MKTSTKRNGKVYTATWVQDKLRHALEQVAKDRHRTVAGQVSFYIEMGLRADGVLPKGEVVNGK